MEARFLKEYGEKYREAYGDIVHYSFRGWAREDALSGWDKMTDSETVIGVTEGDELLSVLIINNFKTVMHGNILRCGGVGAVSTLGIYRNKGATALNLKKSLEHMYENDFVFAPLSPFKYEFYRKYGWELGYSTYYLSFPMDKLDKFRYNGRFFLIKNPDEYKTLSELYENHIFKHNGAILRSEEHWKKSLSNLEKGDVSVAVYEDDNGLNKAYLRYVITDDVFTAYELIYSDTDALKSVLGFIYSHSAQCAKVSLKNIPNPDDVVDIIPSKRLDIAYGQGMMNRVVNAEKALEIYPYTNDGAINIAVSDAVLPQNNGVFTVTVENGKAKSIEKSGKCADISLDIREFSQLITGFRNIDDIRRVERTVITDESKRSFLMFKEPCVLYDHF